MRPILLLSALCVMALGACAQGRDDEPQAAPHHGTQDAEAPTATALYRPGFIPPDSAETKDGDVPRDDYGRPYIHEDLGKSLALFGGVLDNGERFTSADLLGRWTVVEVWGLWCHDSMNDAPYAAALSAALNQDPDVDFMSIHTPQKAERADRAFADYGSVAAYFEEKGYRFPTLIDTDASIRDQLNIRWTPSYLLIAPDGTLQGFRTGLADADGEPVKDFVRQISEIRGDWSSPG